MSEQTATKQIEKIDANTEIDALDNEQLLLLYKKTGDVELKWKLVMRYTDFIKRIATQTCGLYNGFAQLDDVIHEGVIVLLSAVDRFDPSKEVKFETYISKRLRGMIVDLARKNDWLPRHLRQRVVKMNKAIEVLSIKLGRMPDSNEIAQHLGISKQQYNEMFDDMAVTNLMSLEVLLDTYGNASGKIVASTDSKDIPEEIYEEKDLFQNLHKGISHLRENERIVLSLYYEKELTMKEIAHVMGVSAPRVSQIHSRAVRDLRNYMENEYEEFKQ